MRSIAAVIATHNRPELLAARSLPSVAGQTRPPDCLVVVDDSEPSIRPINGGTVAGLALRNTETVYLENARTPGAAGAWNTALSWVQRNNPEAFVAILDDDDAWEEPYLERCEAAAFRQHLDMVASGLIFREPNVEQGRLLDPPQSLNAGDMLIRNTRIQGSNLFVRLGKLLEAGGFDEALASTTDRDLCIRLADLGTVRYGPLNEHLVNHYADDDRPRLSVPGSAAKAAGLQYFYRKHRGRMSRETEYAFLDRSRRLFRADPAEKISGPLDATPVPKSPGIGGHLDSVVGVITSLEIDRVTSLLGSLNGAFEGREDVTLKVILLENGGSDPLSRAALTKAAADAVGQGLAVAVKTLEDQASDAAAGMFDVDPRDLSQRKSIALGRTMLQHYLFLEAERKPGTVVWILDDDLVLEGLTTLPDGSIAVEQVDYAENIKRLKQTGADIVLGEVTGDPPLPFESCVRTQLVDLYHNLMQLASLQPEDPYPDRASENMLARIDRPEYYYDLSRQAPDHLELPFWYQPENKLATAGMVFDELANRLTGILGGVQVFRPLVRSGADDVVAGMEPSVHRGPSTLVFDIQALREFPNAVASLDGSDTRRSDMVWCLLNRFAGGRRIFRAPLPVRQVRPEAPTASSGLDTLLQDMRGHALYSSLYEVLQEKADERRSMGKETYGPSFLELTNVELERAVELYRGYLASRFHAFGENYLRVIGLVSAIRKGAFLPGGPIRLGTKTQPPPFRVSWTTWNPLTPIPGLTN